MRPLFKFGKPGEGPTRVDADSGNDVAEVASGARTRLEELDAKIAAETEQKQAREREKAERAERERVRRAQEERQRRERASCCGCCW